MRLHSETRQSWGFSSTWTFWIKLSLRYTKVTVLVNDICCKRGLRQGDPLSPLIFVLVAEGMHRMIVKCWREDHIKCLGCWDKMNAVINLHYVDDTLIFGKECLPQTMVLKWILLCYEKWSGFKINYHKSSLIFMRKYQPVISLFHWSLTIRSNDYQSHTWDCHSLLASLRNHIGDHSQRGSRRDWQDREVTYSLSEAESHWLMQSFGHPYVLPILFLTSEIGKQRDRPLKRKISVGWDKKRWKGLLLDQLETMCKHKEFDGLGVINLRDFNNILLLMAMKIIWWSDL